MVSRDLFFTKDFSGNRPKLGFETRHAPLSVGVATNVPDFEKGVHFVTNGDKNELVQKLQDSLEHALSSVYELMKRKYLMFFKRCKPMKT